MVLLLYGVVPTVSRYRLQSVKKRSYASPPLSSPQHTLLITIHTAGRNLEYQVPAGRSDREAAGKPGKANQTCSLHTSQYRKEDADGGRVSKVLSHCSYACHIGGRLRGRLEENPRTCPIACCSSVRCRWSLRCIWPAPRFGVGPGEMRSLCSWCAAFSFVQNISTISDFPWSRIPHDIVKTAFGYRGTREARVGVASQGCSCGAHDDETKQQVLSLVANNRLRMLLRA